MQLSAKALLQPLSKPNSGNEDVTLEDSDMAGVTNPDDAIGSDDDEENDSGLDCDDENEDAEELLRDLDEDEKEELIHNMKEAADALQKVRMTVTCVKTTTYYHSATELRICHCAFHHKGTSGMA
jgi:hypothetical protein